MFACTRSVIPMMTSSQILWAIQFPFSCPQEQVLQNAISVGAGAIFGATTNPVGISSLWEFGVADISLSPPIVYSGWYPNDSTTTFGTAVHISYLIPTNPNCTIFLDMPDSNPVQNLYLVTGGSFSIISGLSLAIVCIALVICSAKLFIFYHQSSSKISLATITLSLSIIGLSLSFVQCYSGIGTIGNVSHTAQGAVFEVYPWAMAYTVGILCGFYFKEVSLLSRAPTSLFSTFKWPAIIVVSITWIVFIVIPAVDVSGVVYNNSFYNFSPSGFTPVRQGRLPFIQFYVAISMICLASMNFILVWGVCSVLFYSEPRRFIRLIVVAALMIIFADIFAPMWFFGRYFTGVLINFNYNAVSYYNFINIAASFGPPLVFLSLSFLFSISIDKEIEISKSAKTSSTSGMSSGKSSSSSSSSDPVIEL